MRMRWWLITLVLVPAVNPQRSAAQTLWDRRDPNVSTMFHDYRARNIGDVLTVFIEETTGFDAQETRALGKKTNSEITLNATGSQSGLAGILRQFGYGLDLTNASNRTFAGNNNSSIDRKFTDRMSFIVTDVLPNGNLVVEGSRQRLITREMRILRLRGIVRPADIGPYNTLQSQFLADLYVSYEGKGPESAYTNHGWGGRVFNAIWPF
jgi:flagellar L-ring protein precursor FlgH